MDEVRTREDLVAKLQEMLDELTEIGDDHDRESAFHNGVEEWSNLTLWDFLEAMQAALADNRNSDWPGVDEPRTWEAIYRCLLAGKSYE